MEALGIFKQVCNGALEAFYLKPLCTVVQRLGELQVTCGQYFWSCFSEVGIVAGGASWTDSGPCVQHGRVGLCPELLPCMSGSVSGLLFVLLFLMINPLSIVSEEAECRTTCSWTSAQCGLGCVRMLIVSNLGLFQRGFILVEFGGGKNMFLTLIWVWHLLLIGDQTTEIAHGLLI